MSSVVNVVMIGPAGCGKTSLVASFGEWLKMELGEEPVYINLDPGALSLPYVPDYDVRSLVKVSDLMELENLGPNGAMIRAAEIIEEKLDEIIGEIRILDKGSGFRLIDTPGQMELFLFRDMGPRIVGALSSYSMTAAVYIMDPLLASSSSGLAIGLSMSMITRLRLQVPVVTVINKSDLEIADEVSIFLADESKLIDRIEAEERGLMADLSIKFLDFIKDLSKAMRVIKVSAKTGSGMADLYNIINDALCECGDLT
ncbi:MAG: ATP/GTP-binding protein [Nitrososphaeria archaeon]|nr:ATP/GTP-binding protein [Nitrososphaeria archaeon]MDW8021190.1 ATP/GTP-binding protein [Nitrososphaerota archaeon]